MNFAPPSRSASYARNGAPHSIHQTVSLLEHADQGVTLDGSALFTAGRQQLIAAIERSLVEHAEPRLVVTVNVDQVLTLGEDEEFAATFHTAFLRVIDGMPLLWLARMLGLGGAHRHPGSDLIFDLSAAAAESGWRVAIVGGRSSTGAAAAASLRRLYPRLDVAAVPFPMLSPALDGSTASVLEDLRARPADLVFLCLGSPKQEKWFARNRDALPPGVYIGAGAAVDFAAGTRRRAPSVLQHAGLEWLWRLLQEPGRLWRRYLLHGPRFVFVIARALRHAH